LSGSLFVIAIDPLLFMFERRAMSPAYGLVAACADDVGAFLEELRHLAILSDLFKPFQTATGLTLKPRKCVIILLSVVASDVNVCRVRLWLERHVPQWASFSVAAHGKCLGFHLGPGGESKQWEAPIAKHKERAEEIARLDLPMQLSGARYNSRAVTVLGYVAQLSPLPKGLCNVELASGSKALGFAPRALSNGALFSLDSWKGVKLVQPSLYALACRIRAAAKTLSGFASQHNELVKPALDGVPLGRALDPATCDMPIPDGWSRQAFSSTLFLTSELGGLECNSEQREAVRAVLSDFRQGSGRKNLQSRVYKALVENRSSDWGPLLERRVAMFRADWLKCPAQAQVTPRAGSFLMPSPAAWHCSSNVTQAWAMTMKGLGVSNVMITLKTWTNAWCTTTRYHEMHLWPCIFGCSDCDD